MQSKRVKRKKAKAIRRKILHKLTRYSINFANFEVVGPGQTGSWVRLKDIREALDSVLFGEVDDNDI